VSTPATTVEAGTGSRHPIQVAGPSGSSSTVDAPGSIQVAGPSGSVAASSTTSKKAGRPPKKKRTVPKPGTGKRGGGHPRGGRKPILDKRHNSPPAGPSGLLPEPRTRPATRFGGNPPSESQTAAAFLQTPSGTGTQKASKTRSYIFIIHFIYFI